MKKKRRRRTYGIDDHSDPRDGLEVIRIVGSAGLVHSLVSAYKYTVSLYDHPGAQYSSGDLSSSTHVSINKCLGRFNQKRNSRANYLIINLNKGDSNGLRFHRR